MSTNYVPLEQAAKMLGMTVDQLNDMRLKNKIFGMRDGNQWKFKVDELNRFADEMGINIGPLKSGLSDSVDLLGDSGDLILDDSADMIKLDDSLDVLNDGISLGDSDISLAAESSGNVLGSGSDVSPDKASASDTGKMLGSGVDDELFEDDLMLQESVSFDGSSDLPSDLESSDLILDDSDSDSDEVDLDSADTGISLGPTDSGIVLEDEPLELGGSDIDSLELPEDDEVVSLEDAVDSDSVEFGSADDDFNLTPLEDSIDEDFSSGSQVIALEDSAVYTDDSVPTMLSDEDFAAKGNVSGQEVYGQGPYVDAQAAMAYVPPEAPYSIWNVLSLAVAFVIVLLLTIVSIDLARNMWQPSGVTLSNSVVNFFLRLFGWNVQD
ncbi:MAG TPA: helix-turn-helix domain-containing protein [Pirellulaceae bacterium]|nr:helix-turn-helix domain-containing protein [Pirellulaceae bacterium]HMO93604.1 helix-turn-helix domain-containing protein [Pirellulaceae bacterium]HMP70528.1 helix-turn-helix domain-containing protein [Pirellulaceae bacterium]